MKILVFEIFEKGQILRPFLGLAPSKLKIFSKKFDGSIYAYRVFYLPIFSKIEGGGGESTPPSPCGTEKSVVLRGLSNLSPQYIMFLITKS